MAPYLFVLLLLPQSGGDGIKRFENYIRKANTLSVQVTATAIGRPEKGIGSIIFSRPGNARFSMKWMKDDYTYVKNPTEALEYSIKEKRYQAYSALPDLFVEGSQFSWIQEYGYPGFVLAGTLQGVIPPDANFAKTAAGSGYEVYTAKWQGNGRGNVAIKIADDGRILTYDVTYAVPEGSRHLRYEFSNYVLDQPIPDSKFNTYPPTGLSEYALPVKRPLLMIGRVVSLGTWHGPRGAANLDPLARGKMLLVVDPETIPNQNMLAYLRQRKLPVETIILSLSTPAGGYTSPTEAVRNEVASLGTPLIVWLDDKNAVKRLWLGFDPENPKALFDEIEKAVSEKEEE